MTPEDLINIQNKISNLSDTIKNINATIAGLKIDNQMMVRSNSLIPPATSTRVTFDSKGLILKGEDLRVDDIPILPIEKINGLKSILNDKVDRSTSALVMPNTTDNSKHKIIAGSGIKINYNSEGMIVSSSDELSESDIPNLNIDKIIGLNDRLSVMETSIDGMNNVEVKEYKVTPGTFTKISFDNEGRVINGQALSLDDIPRELIKTINTVESRIPELASQKSLDALTADVKNKLEANVTPVVPGVYTKVTVDKKGLITDVANLDIHDLPDINMSNVIDLESTIRKLAKQSDLVDLTNTVSALASNNSITSMINNIQTDLNNRIIESDSNVKTTMSKVDTLQHTIDSLVDKLPAEFILTQLTDIQNKMSNLTLRISTIEKQLNIPS